MAPTTLFRGLSPVLLLLALAACGTDGGGTLFPPTPIGPSPNPRLVSVVDGVSSLPVPSARVVLDTRTYTTDQQGRLELDAAVPCAATTVNAVGYLERRMKCLSSATSGGAAPVSLWPAASPEERTAVQQFAFRGQINLVYPSAQAVFLSYDIPDPSSSTAAWQRAAGHLSDASRGTLTASLPQDVTGADDGLIVAPWSEAAQCSATAHYDEASPGRQFLWPLGVSGLCWQARPYPLLSVVRLEAAHVARDSTALRALLIGAGFGPHTLPGLMNRTAPADTLSDFERGTLLMVGLRARSTPSGTTWPDTER